MSDITDDVSDTVIDQLIEAGDELMRATLELKEAKAKVASCSERYKTAYENFYHKPFVAGKSI